MSICGNPNKKVFLLIGNKRSGKSTFVEGLRASAGELGLTVEEKQLAGHLKYTCAKVFGIPEEYFESQAMKETPLRAPVELNHSVLELIFKEFGLGAGFIHATDWTRHLVVELRTPRQILQYVGTQVLRSEFPEIHTEITIEAIKTSRADVVVVPDCRFPNELSLIKERFEPIVVYIQNDKAEEEAKLESHETEKHTASLARSASVVIQNNDTKDGYLDRARRLSSVILSKKDSTHNANGEPNKKIILPALILWFSGISVTIMTMFTDTPTAIIVLNIVLSSLSTMMNIELRTLPDSIIILKNLLKKHTKTQEIQEVALNKPESIGRSRFEVKTDRRY